MAHEVETYIGRLPAWHKLGHDVGKAFSAEDALTIAKLDWEVQLLPVQVATFNGTTSELIESEDYYATVRQSPVDGEWNILGAGMTSAYRPVQNREAFSFMDEVVGTIEGSHYETAGALRGGRQVFMSVQGEAVDLDEKGRADRINQYLLGVNSHDGSLAFGLLWTPVRVVCANTLGMAVGRGRGKTKQSSRWTTRHTRDVLDRAHAARRTLDIGHAFMEEWADEARAMIEAKLTDDKFNRIVKDLFTNEDDVTDEDALLQIETIYETSRTVENVRGTVWGGLNATTEYLDWYTKVRGGKRTSMDEMRFRRQVNWEAGNDKKQDAWDRFLAECEDSVAASA